MFSRRREDPRELLSSGLTEHQGIGCFDRRPGALQLVAGRTDFLENLFSAVCITFHPQRGLIPGDDLAETTR